MNRSILAIAVASLLPHASLSYAQAVSADETMVVTANRFEQSSSDVIAPIEIVTKEEIEAIQAKSLTEVLRRLPGVQIASNGGYGQTTSVFIRGSESDHVLVLMNGVRIGDAYSGGAAINAISLNGVERIEYIRGPRTAIYGSDALGGVINIITSYTDPQIEVSAGLGSDNLNQVQLLVAEEITENTWGKLSLNRLETDGFDVTVSDAGDQGDDDGFKSEDAALELGVRFNENWTARLNGDYADTFVEYDQGEIEQRLYNLSLVTQYQTESFHSDLVLGTNEDKKYYPSFDSNYQTNRDTMTWSNFFALANDMSVNAGIDWYKDDVSSTSSDLDETSRTNTAVYLTGLYNGDVLQLEGSARTDDNQRYGRNNTWQLGLGYRFSEHYRVTGNTGTAFKAPTFSDLYSPLVCYPTCYSGNPNLKPEESKNYEVAIEADYSYLSVRLAAYRNDIDNLILGDIKENVGEARIEGIEISSTFETGPISHSASFDWMDPKDLDNDEQLARRAKHSGKWNMTYFGSDWQVDISYLYQGERPDLTANDITLDSYSLVDFAGTYFVSDSFSVRARISNLLDEEYETAGGYNTQDRSYFASVKYQF
ncbi:TonB-dependent receptor [Vibrio sp. Isolate25]|uniref:TonB-dependent receptor domain-containing protein n=1 Tax=Vibrio sp. Isolate25 TaxID=2908535 RepID=UPI001EFDFABF|nr:TonB-dependent receptor [Vibrio sp. Isolate25]MCG9598669.1 TonB-dependent receptor [Vibrio sp. Isolate25]